MRSTSRHRSYNLAVTGATTSSGSVTPTPTNGKVDVSIAGTGDDSALGGTVDDARFAVDCDPATPSNTCVTTPLVLESPGSGHHRSKRDPARDRCPGPGPGIAHGLPAEPRLRGLVGPRRLRSPWSSTRRHRRPARCWSRRPPTTALWPTRSTRRRSASRARSPTSAPRPPRWSPPRAGSRRWSVAARLLRRARTTAPAWSSRRVTAPSAFDGGVGVRPRAAEPLTAYPDGTYQVWMHAKDAAGNWGTWTPTSFTVKRGLFADGFESGSVAAWTGGPTPNPAAARLAVTTAAHSAGTYGLAVAASGTAAATVQTPAVSPVAATYQRPIRLQPQRPSDHGDHRAHEHLHWAQRHDPGLPGAVPPGQPHGSGPGAAVLLGHQGHAVGDARGRPPGSTIQVDSASGKRATLTLTVNGAASARPRR